MVADTIPKLISFVFLETFMGRLGLVLGVARLANLTTGQFRPLSSFLKRLS